MHCRLKDIEESKENTYINVKGSLKDKVVYTNVLNITCATNFLNFFYNMFILQNTIYAMLSNYIL